MNADGARHRERLSPHRLTVERGAWSAALIDDELVDITWNDHRLLDGVRAVIRDRDWRTVPTRVVGTDVRDGLDGLVVTVTVSASDAGIRYTAALTVELTGNTFSVHLTGRAESDFLSNRIGLIVLHPLANQGAAVTIEHVDGGRTRSRFPTTVSPHQPFRDIAAMNWTRDGVSARLEFSGDVFETEDHRNWTDASFKTYSRPLDLPFPFAVTEGEQIEQRVVLRVRSGSRPARPARPAARRDDEAVEHVIWIGPAGPAVVPALDTSAFPDGTGTADAVVAGSPDLDGSLAGLAHPVPGLAAVLLELDTTADGWLAGLRRGLRAAEHHDAGLDLRLIVDDVTAAEEVLRHLGRTRLRRLAAYDANTHVTEPRHWRWLAQQRDRGRPGTSLLAGTRAHFAELNRSASRLTAVLAEADGVTFSVTPQMHATEVRHIVSSVMAQSDVARDAVAIAGGSPVHIGPVTLKPRFNAVATSTEGGSVTAAQGADELQGGSFTAAWTLASIAALTRPGVASIAYFGLRDLAPVPAGEGADNPTARLLGQLAPLNGRPVLRVADRPDERVTVYPVDTGARVRIFVSNLSRRPIRLRLRLRGWSGTDLVVTLAPWSYGHIDRPDPPG